MQSAHLGADAPGFVPTQALHIHQQSHHLWDGHGGVGVVQLDGNLLVELVEVRAHLLNGTELGRFVPVNKHKVLII